MGNSVAGVATDPLVIAVNLDEGSGLAADADLGLMLRELLAMGGASVRSERMYGNRAGETEMVCVAYTAEVRIAGRGTFSGHGETLEQAMERLFEAVEGEDGRNVDALSG